MDGICKTGFPRKPISEKNIAFNLVTLMPAPYTIEHLQLSDLSDLEDFPGNRYLVFWLGDLPLGHLWWANPGQTGRSAGEQAITGWVRNVLEPALEYYLGKCNDLGPGEWKGYLAGGEYSRLAALLTNCFRQSAPDYRPQSISVVVCTRNRPAAAERCLQSLKACDDQDFEVIVVDNASDDDLTEKMVTGFPGVKYIPEKRKGLDIARNTGILHAGHDIVAFTDDDVSIPSNWIQTIKSCFTDPLTMAATGLVIPLELKTPSQFIFEKEWSFNKGYLPVVFDHQTLEGYSGKGAWEIGAGANMAFRKRVFELVGLFDERLDVGAAGCSGDSEIWYRILAEGWRCNYFPQLYVYHRHRQSMEDLRRQLFSYMRGHVCALLIQHEKYGHKCNLVRLYRVLPLYYFNRIRQYLCYRHKREDSTLSAEIKGCISGYKYYQSNKKGKGYDE